MSASRNIAGRLALPSPRPLSVPLLATGLFLAALIGAPLAAPPAVVNDLIQMASYGLFAISFNILFRQAGLLSFGHSAFFGFAAYGTALGLQALPGVPLILAVPAAGLATALLGLGLGQLCVRREGAYFSMTTLAIAAFFATVAGKWDSVTGGTDGLDGFMPGRLVLLPGWVVGQLSLAQTYWLELAFIIPFGLAAVALLELTPLGNAIRAVRHNAARAAFLGYDTHAVKLTGFVLAAFLAGIAGALWAVGNGFVSTDAIDLPLSTNVIIMAMLGGTGWFWGPMLGAMLYVAASDKLSALTPHWQLWFGAFFILVVLFAPGGLSGVLAGLWKRVRRHG